MLGSPLALYAGLRERARAGSASAAVGKLRASCDRRVSNSFRNDLAAREEVSKLKLAGDLIAEFRDLKEDRNEETGTVRIVHREGKHDDMAICVASTVWWTMQPKHGGVTTLRAAPYGSHVAIARGEIDPRSLPVVSRKMKPWRYS